MATRCAVVGGENRAWRPFLPDRGLCYRQPGQSRYPKNRSTFQTRGYRRLVHVLKPVLKPVLKSFFSSRPVWHTAGAMLRPRGVYVLMYHRVDDSQAGFHGLGKERFEAQLAWLNNNCTIIDPEQLDQYLNRPPRRRPAVLLTFDDGYRCVHSIVAPALRKFKVRGLVFLPTRIIDEESLVWTDRLNWAFSQTSAANICFSWDHENEYQLETAAERSRALGRCKAHLKQLPDNERRAREQEVLESLDMLSKSAQLPRQMLNWNEVRDT
ncbi:MAG TPA: hypothetical protein ENJ01_05445, partial [Gammaproteobacteria bacterium]|nr:hypothetical protein [Gammaproteobacteria bacterium]